MIESYHVLKLKCDSLNHSMAEVCSGMLRGEFKADNHGKAVHMARRAGWTVNPHTQKAYCPACGRRK
ncbi:hypothetical protein LCGC14_2589090 [marine sediment metagenome]|uniref:Uncharacterized protein n=1 Tax=marine sediment metagenome TaxID=412755 RepID=A0A0F9CN88_9ZZZZ